MNRFSFALLNVLMISGCLQENLFSNTVLIENREGKEIEVGIDGNDRFFDVLNRIEAYFREETNKETDYIAPSSQQSLQWNLAISHAGVVARSKQEIKRDYNAPVTKGQKDDIGFVVTTLAWGGAIELGKKSGELNATKPRIERVHPLNFLRVIFSNEKLIAGIAAIKERKMPGVKSRFFKELRDSLSEEASLSNLLPFVDDFAEKLDIDKKKIYPSLEKGKYDEFVDILIELKPRENADRHNM